MTRVEPSERPTLPLRRISGPREILPAFFRELAAPPDPRLARAQVLGGRVSAWFRLALVAALALLPLLDRLAHAGGRPDLLAVEMIGTMLALAVLVALLARRPARQTLAALCASVVDVGVVSAFLVAHARGALPAGMLDGRILFDLYLVALALSCLRYDPRVAAFTGVLASAAYVAIALVVVPRLPPSTPALAPELGGVFEPGAVLPRTLLLMLATWVAVLIAHVTRPAAPE